MQGFTLLELMIVIVIMAILAIAPFFNWPGTSLNLEGQAQQLTQDIRYTQALSMSQAQRYRLVITAGTSSYQILNSSGAAVSFPSGSTTVTLGSGISFGTFTNLPNSLIVFDGKGIPYTTTGTPGTALATAATIPLQAGGSTKTVVVTPLTGRVNVQ
jgi:prepilin-type N-terminal cleavage/methylation domain-containing protein